MFYYQTPIYVDCIIWSFPTVICFIVRPYIRTNLPKNYLMILAILGCFLTAASIFSAFDVLSFQIKNITICTFGWVSMDIAIQLLSPYAQNFSFEFPSTIIGYFVCLICMSFDFKIGIALSYLIAGSIGIIIFFFIKNQQTQLQFDKNTIFQQSQLSKNPIKEIILIVMKDIFQIYTVIWCTLLKIASRQEDLTFKIKYGCLMLSLFEIFRHGSRLYGGSIKTVICVCATVWFFAQWSKFSIIAVTITNGIFIGSYQKNYNNQNEKTTITVNKTNLIAKILILNILPFFSLIILNRNDIQDAILWLLLFQILLGIIIFLQRDMNMKFN